MVDVLVIGGGAAGMMCAAEAGRRGRRVAIVEHWRRVGERIRISGGGRCNFTNRRVGAEHYLSGNPHFCRSALARFGPGDFISWLDRHGVAHEERDRGQLFCRGSAQEVVDAFRRELDAAGVRWMTPCTVAGVQRVADARPGTRFRVTTSLGPVDCASVVIATGGLAAPQIGATPFGYDVARQFGLRVIEPRPALVPLTLTDEDFSPWRPLAGVAFDAEAACANHEDLPAFSGRCLVTHRSLSGPAILQVSSYAQRLAPPGGAPAPVRIDLLPGLDADAWLASHRQSDRSLQAVLATRLPRRLADMLVARHGWPRTLANASNRVLSGIAAQLNAHVITPVGTLGFEKAEVTLGGVDTDALSSKTMEAVQVPGLYFVGEVVDVTGWLGGYNFQWAWSSGWVAGQYA